MTFNFLEMKKKEIKQKVFNYSVKEEDDHKSLWEVWNPVFYPDTSDEMMLTVGTTDVTLVLANHCDGKMWGLPGHTATSGAGQDPAWVWILPHIATPQRLDTAVLILIPAGKHVRYRHTAGYWTMFIIDLYIDGYSK